MKTLCRRHTHPLFAWHPACSRHVPLPSAFAQVFVHSLKKVDITAQVGSTTTAALAIRGAASDRQVATYSSKPSLLQPQPPRMLLPAGGVAELGLVFRPVTTGTEQVSVGDARGDHGYSPCH